MQTFDEALVRDSKIRPLLKKVRVIADSNIEALMPDTMMVRAVIKLGDGTLHEVKNINPLGHPANPMTDEDIAKKFYAQSVPVIGEESSSKVINAWSTLADVSDLRPLIKMMDIP